MRSGLGWGHHLAQDSLEQAARPLSVVGTRYGLEPGVQVENSLSLQLLRGKTKEL